MKAKDIQPGDVFKDEAETYWTVAHVNRGSRAFKMGLDGHPDKFAVIVSWKGISDWSLFHPEEDVGEPARRAQGVNA